MAQKGLLGKVASNPDLKGYLQIMQKQGPLFISQDWLNKKRETTGGDHREHFEGHRPANDPYPNSRLLSVQDMEIMPSIWRMPDTVQPSGVGNLVLEVPSLEGDNFRLVVGIFTMKNGVPTPRQFPVIKTFHRV